MSNARDKANIPSLNFSSTGIDDNATSTAITINSSENVLVGDTSVTDASSSAKVYSKTGYGIITNNNENAGGIKLSSSSTNALIFQADPNNQRASTEMFFFIDGSEKMKITSGGNVGIGTSSPNRVLTLGGTANARLGLNASSYRNYSLSSDVYGFSIYDDTSTAYRLTVNSSGNVGIGTTSPSAELHIYRGDGEGDANLILETGTDSGSVEPGIYLKGYATNSEPSIYFGDRFAYPGAITYDNVDNHLHINTNGTERMRIDSSGKVGINNSAPSTELEVYGTIKAHEKSGLAQASILIDATATGNPHLAFQQAGAYKGYIHYLDASDTICLNDGSGNGLHYSPSQQKLGIGTSSPSSYYANHLVVDIGSTAQSGITIVADSSNQAMLAFADGTSGDTRYRGYLDYNHSNDSLAFASAGTERMRIDSSGNLLVGTTDILSASNTTDSGCMLTSSHGWITSNGVSSLRLQRLTSTGLIQTFYYSGSLVGDIAVTASSTSYNTSSDHRLKENVSYDFDATTRLKQLKPARFNFIANANTTVDGFLAHEVQSIVPEAITGTKDATETKEKVVVNSNGQVIAENIEQADWETGKIADEDGNTQYPTDSTWEATKVVPVYQGIDQSKLVPLLVKTIQELEARITTLEANNP